MALGTLSLALFTFLLAQSTKRDVEAQWRPLLVPVSRQDTDASGAAVSGWAYLTDLGDFRFAFKNVGKGAALDVIGHVSDVMGPEGRMYWQCESLWSPVMAVEAHADFRWATTDALVNNRIRVLVFYSDLAGNAYRTEAEYERLNNNWTWLVRRVTPRRRQYVGRRARAVRKARWVLGTPFRTVVGLRRRLRGAGRPDAP